jgi:hypothetical protein
VESPGNPKAQLFDLYDQDREAIARIRELQGLNSNALVVRLALRELRKRLDASLSAQGADRTLSAKENRPKDQIEQDLG